MRKSTLSLLTCSILFASPVSAITLEVGNEALSNVEVESFAFNNGVLKLTLSSASANLGVVDASDPGNGGTDPGNGGSDPDDEVPPVLPGECITGGNIVCMPAINWSSGESRLTVSVDKGKIMVTPFTTTPSGTFEGTVSFQDHSGADKDFWISTTPGGPVLNDGVGRNDRRCGLVRGNGNGNYGISWTQSFNDRQCILAPSTPYYMNIKNHFEESGSSTLWRYRTNNGQ